MMYCDYQKQVMLVLKDLTLHLQVEKLNGMFHLMNMLNI